MIQPSRRGFIAGLGALIAAPAIVRVASIMPVKTLPISLTRHPWYDHEASHRMREEFYIKMMNPAVIANPDGTYTKIPFDWNTAHKIMGSNVAKSEHRQSEVRYPGV